MLAANEAVARWFGDRELPTIYRVHGLPDEDKLRTFLDLARAQGFEVPEDETGPLALADLLEQLAGHPQQRALNQLLLRAMMQAVYSPENIGHYGLAAEHYLHFTSPIRRYPDLIVHRLLREALGGAAGRKPRAGELERVALLASDRERAAMKAERDVNAYYADAVHGRPGGGAQPGHGLGGGRVRPLRVHAPVVRRGAREGRGPRGRFRPRQGRARPRREAERPVVPGRRRPGGRGVRGRPGPPPDRPRTRGGRKDPGARRGAPGQADGGGRARREAAGRAGARSDPGRRGRVAAPRVGRSGAADSSAPARGRRPTALPAEPWWSRAGPPRTGGCARGRPRRWNGA